MSELIFGSILLIVSTILTAIWLIAGDGLEIFFMLFICILWIVSIIIFIKGLKPFLANRKK